MKFDEHETMVVAAGFVVLSASVIIPMAQRVAEERLVRQMTANAADFQRRIENTLGVRTVATSVAGSTNPRQNLTDTVGALVDTLVPDMAMAEAIDSERWKVPSTHALSERSAELKEVAGHPDDLHVTTEWVEGRARMRIGRGTNDTR